MSGVWLAMYTNFAFVSDLHDRKVNIQIMGNPGGTPFSEKHRFFNILDLHRPPGMAVAFSYDQRTNPKMEERKMRTDGQTIRGSELAIPHVDLETVKEWAKAAFTKERMAEVGVVAATLVVTGYLGATLFRGIQTYAMSGF